MIQDSFVSSSISAIGRTLAERTGGFEYDAVKGIINFKRQTCKYDVNRIACQHAADHVAMECIHSPALQGRRLHARGRHHRGTKGGGARGMLSGGGGHPPAGVGAPGVLLRVYALHARLLR